MKLKHKIERVVYTDKLFEYAKEIKEIPLTKTDIENAIKEIDNYIDNDIVTARGKSMNLKDLNIKYTLFKKEDLEKYFNESIEFILKQIKLT